MAPKAGRAATIVTKCGARVRADAAMDSLPLGSLPHGTPVVVAPEKRLVKCLARGGEVVARTRLLEPCAGWVSYVTLKFQDDDEAFSPADKPRRNSFDNPANQSNNANRSQTTTHDGGGSGRRNTIENHNLVAGRRRSFADGDDLTRYLATAEDSEDLKEWKQRAARVVVRQQQRALAAVRRKRLVKSVELERQQAELDALKAEEAHITQLILEGLQKCRVGSSQVQLTTRDDLLVATRGRSYEIPLLQQTKASPRVVLTKKKRVSGGGESPCPSRTKRLGGSSTSLRSLTNVYDATAATKHTKTRRSGGRLSGDFF